VTLLLAVVGVGVVILGAVILLVLPDRPGGTIGWGDFQVKSRGAGMPLIVVGLVSIGFALSRVGGSASTSSTSPTSTTEGAIYAAEFEGETRHPWTGGTYVGGEYQLEAQRVPDRLRVFASPPASAPGAEDAGFAVTARHTGSAEEGYGYGIFCRKTDENNLYAFTLWAHTATIAKRIGGVFKPRAISSVGYGAADEGDAGLQLHAVCASADRGSAVFLKFWVTKGGKPLGERPLENTDPEPLEGTTYGLFAALGKGGGSAGDTLLVQFDDFIVTHAG
jgi:hypothetical protein